MPTPSYATISTEEGEQATRKGSAMQKAGAFGLVAGLCVLSFVAGSHYTAEHAAASSANDNVPAGEFFWISQVSKTRNAFFGDGTGQPGHMGILGEPNDPKHWDTVAKAYCDVCRAYCAYEPQCPVGGSYCRPEDIRNKWLDFCQGPKKDGVGPREAKYSMKSQACNHLDYVNGPGR
jgi:hypothetical protein